MLPDSQRSSQAKGVREPPDAVPIDETAKEALTLLVLGTPVPPRARKRALAWLEAEIQRENDYLLGCAPGSGEEPGDNR